MGRPLDCSALFLNEAVGIWVYGHTRPQDLLNGRLSLGMKKNVPLGMGRMPLIRKLCGALQGRKKTGGIWHAELSQRVHQACS